MKVTKLTIDLGSVYEVYMAILALEAGNKTLPFKFSWKLDDLKDVFKKHVERYEKQRKTYLEEYGEPNKENPNMYNVLKENIEAYNAKIKDMNEEKIEVEFVPLTYKILEGIDSLQVPPGVLTSLRTNKLLVEEEKKEDKKEEPEKT